MMNLHTTQYLDIEKEIKSRKFYDKKRLKMEWITSRRTKIWS